MENDLLCGIFHLTAVIELVAMATRYLKCNPNVFKTELVL